MRRARALGPYHERYSCATLHCTTEISLVYPGALQAYTVHFLYALKVTPSAFSTQCLAICWVEELKTDVRQQANKPTGS
jgi:hypothetical protein